MGELEQLWGVRVFDDYTDKYGCWACDDDGSDSIFIGTRDAAEWYAKKRRATLPAGDVRTFAVHAFNFGATEKSGWGASMQTAMVDPRTLDDLKPALQALFDAYLKVEPDGDTSTFSGWLNDEVPALRHDIQCDCDCHANAAVWPGPHCEQCKPGSS